MDWAFAIERHRDPLLRIVATLFAMIGLTEGGSVERVKWPLYRTVLALLRPAEAAVRRLIIAAAQGMVVKQRASRPFPKGLAKSRKTKTRASFPLFDPLVDHENNSNRPAPATPRVEPRIRWLGSDPVSPLYHPYHPPAAPQPQPKPERQRRDTVNAGPLCRRLVAIQNALKNLKRQARRYARWLAKPKQERSPERDAALRPGPPPYLRKTSSHEVHAILEECHWLARTAREPNSS